ncbi:MAG: D-lyxose/D-mannose family sugar isomerase [Kiritimatiellia bacterium]
MKRSTVNEACREAVNAFADNGWTLPPDPRWDVTDFGLGDFERKGLVLINLAEEPEYCEKLMYAREKQETPAHTHRKKKEDIICRRGKLCLQLWSGVPGEETENASFELKVNGVFRNWVSGEILTLMSGERVTLVPGIYHRFWPEQGPAVIGEVSTANDDLHDNIFLDPEIGRFSAIEEDEPVVYSLVSDSKT